MANIGVSSYSGLMKNSQTGVDPGSVPYPGSKGFMMSNAMRYGLYGVGALGLGMLSPGLLMSGIGADILGQIIQNQMARRNADYAYGKDLEMMRYQNEYNSPQNQMKRLEQAGLNPNLVYGGGNVTGNLNGNVPHAQIPQTSFNLDPLSKLFMFQQIQTQQLMQDKLQADTINLKTRSAGELIKNKILTTDNLKKIFEYDFMKMTAGSQADILKQKVNIMTQEVTNSIAKGELLGEQTKSEKARRSLFLVQLAKTGVDLEIQKKILAEWKDTGLSPNAPWYIRLGRKILEDMGVNSWEEMYDIIAPQ